MLIPVKSGLFGRVIQEQRVVRVAKGAFQEVREGKADDSRYMGPADNFYDIFCDRVKRKTIENVHGLAIHSAILSQELGRLENDRNVNVITEESNVIERYKESIGRVMPGRSIGFGCEGQRPIVDADSFVIYRDQSKIAPSTFALYPSSRPGPAVGGPPIPTFKEASVIKHSDLENIRNKGFLRCGKNIYKIRFHEYDEPMVIGGKSTDTAVQNLQTVLSKLAIQTASSRALQRLERIGAIEVALALPPTISPDYSEDAEWRREAELAENNLQGINKFFVDNSAARINSLNQIFSELTTTTIFPVTIRKKFDDAIIELRLLEKTQIKREKLVLDVKQIYSRLYYLGGICESPQIRLCLHARVSLLNSCFRDFVRFPKLVDPQRRFPEAITLQQHFLNGFQAEKLADCTDLSREVSALKVTSTAMDQLLTDLEKTLSDPAFGWREISDAMEKLRAALRAARK